MLSYDATVFLPVASIHRRLIHQPRFRPERERERDRDREREARASARFLVGGHDWAHGAAHRGLGGLR